MNSPKSALIVVWGYERDTPHPSLVSAVASSCWGTGRGYDGCGHNPSTPDLPNAMRQPGLWQSVRRGEVLTAQPPSAVDGTVMGRPRRQAANSSTCHRKPCAIDYR